MAGASITSTPRATAMAMALLTLTLTVVGQTEAQADGTAACIDGTNFVSFSFFPAVGTPRFMRHNVHRQIV